MGGESIQIERAMDILSIGYVHPAMLVLFSIWAVGRASGAIAGEIDRGTMELLLAQPLARYRVVLTHLAIDAMTIPLLCLSMWAGAWAGFWFFTPIKVSEPTPENPKYQQVGKQIRKLIGAGKETTLSLEELEALIKEREDLSKEMADKNEQERTQLLIQILQQQLRDTNGVDADERKKLLEVRPMAFAPSLCNVAALLFAISGYTMWLSAGGRYRWKVMGLAVLVTLLQFLVNLLGQLWETIQWLRPLTVFYYYQPQDIILNGRWTMEQIGRASCRERV